MNSSNIELRTDSSAPVEVSPDQQLAGRISETLAARNFKSNVKSEALVTKIASGQMSAEDWRIMAASTLQTEDKTVEEPTHDENRGPQS